jgi:hypothetical protein
MMLSFFVRWRWLSDELGLGTRLASKIEMLFCFHSLHFASTKRNATMASYTGGEQNVNRLISANASFTRQRDDARRTKQLAEERLNLVKKDSELVVRYRIAATVTRIQDSECIFSPDNNNNS